MTFDDEFTQDRSINTNKWNGGAGGTDWCRLNFHGKSGGDYMFREGSDPCGQHYDGCTLSRTNGLEMRSPGSPSAAMQTGGTTVQNSKFIQKFGYWEARFKVPHSTNGEGRGIHSDFWMHPIPEGVRSPAEWLPEINVGERPTWDAKLESANNKMYFGIHDYGHDYGGTYGTSPLTDLSADWHIYGLYWRDDGSGPYGSMQFYLDGSPLLSPYALSSKATNMANGIYMFLSLDNDKTGGSSANPFMVQYVRVWRLDPLAAAATIAVDCSQQQGRFPHYNKFASHIRCAGAASTALMKKVCQGGLIRTFYALDDAVVISPGKYNWNAASDGGEGTGVPDPVTPYWEADPMVDNIIGY
ncbi:MAG: family 16 glycosylhydrolase [Thermoguttaceae bacterium]